MKTLPALVAFFIVYYFLWFLSLPIAMLKNFLNAVSGHLDE